MMLKISRNFHFFKVPKELLKSFCTRVPKVPRKSSYILKNSAIQLYLKSRALWAFFQNAIAHQSSCQNLEETK